MIILYVILREIEIVPVLFYFMGIFTTRNSTPISRTMIFIDGHYFENRVHTILDEGINHPELDKTIRYDEIHGEINYSAFAGHLIQHSSFGTPTLVRCYYYDGLPDPDQNLSYLDEIEQTQRENELKNQYVKKKEYLDKIAILDYFEVRKGKAVYSRNSIKEGKMEWGFRQKGVDSLIAIDMLTKAYQGQYDVGILVTGDSDFIEIVKSVKNSGVNIMGAYFEKNMPKELEHEFDRKFVIQFAELIGNNILK